ncbi:hypothetical protein ABVT39_018959 [Epinephelus coioides]
MTSEGRGEGGGAARERERSRAERAAEITQSFCAAFPGRRKTRGRRHLPGAPEHERRRGGHGNGGLSIQQRKEGAKIGAGVAVASLPSFSCRRDPMLSRVSARQ